MSSTPSKERFSSPLLPFARNTIIAILLSVAPANNALAANNISDSPSSLIKPPKPEETKCHLTGGVNVNDDVVKLQAACTKGEEIIMGDLILSPDKSGHYNIPNSEAYFYISTTGNLLISFIRNGKRMTGMMNEIAEGIYDFRQYFFYLTNTENK